MLSNEGRLVGPSQGGALARLFPAPPGRTRSQKKRRIRGSAPAGRVVLEGLAVLAVGAGLPGGRRTSPRATATTWSTSSSTTTKVPWMVGPARGARNFVPRGVVYSSRSSMPLDVRLDEARTARLSAHGVSERVTNATAASARIQVARDGGKAHTSRARRSSLHFFSVPS